MGVDGIVQLELQLLDDVILSLVLGNQLINPYEQSLDLYLFVLFQYLVLLDELLSLCL